MIIDKLIDAIKRTDNPSVVGLDTCLDYLPQDMLAKVESLDDAAEQIFEFNKNIIDNIFDIVPAVKVQVAYYEMYGYQGMKAFKQTVDYAKSKGMIVIADVKRNDIGSTAGCYSKAYLSGVEVAGKKIIAFDSDYITVNGYLGSDGILPFVKDCKENDKGLFILVKTSNPTSGELQDKKFENGNTLYEEMGDLVEKWGSELIGKYGYSSIGAVVGATHREQAEIIRKRNPHTFFLIPGYGGKAEDLAVCFENGIGGIVNSSRGILCAYKKDKYQGMDYAKAARQASIDMREDLNSAIKK